MPDIPFPISSAPGVKQQEGAGRLINCFAEKQEQGAPFPVIWRRCAGLRQVLSVTDHSHFRGGILVASTLIAVFDTRAYAVTRSGEVYSATNLGALNGTDMITVAKNNAATPDIVAVTSEGAFNLFTGSAPSSFADADLPQPVSVNEIDGYLIFPIGDGRIFATGLNAVTVATNSFTTEQGLVNRRGVTFRGEVFIFGDKWTGVYRDAGTSPFPLERRFTIPKGIAGTHAIAGWEPGWANELIWVGEDSIVYKMNGYTPVAISNHDVARDIEAAGAAGDHDQLEATVYMHGGHAIWRLNYPDNWTWEYNNTTSNWHERKSYGREDCRGSGSVRAFDEWIIGDRESGKLFAIDGDYYREGDDPLIAELISGPVAQFPTRYGSPRADFNITAAVGVSSGEDPVQTDPSVLISWSNDGGATWSNPVPRAIGSEGEGKRVARVNRIGLVSARGKRFRLQVSDPVHFGFQGASLVADGRAA
jgi:hypothetical protein